MKKRNFYYLTNFLIQIEFVLRRFLAIIFKKYFDVDLGESFRFLFLEAEIYILQKK